MEDTVILQIVRKEGGAVDIKASDGIQLEEVAGAMIALSDLCKMNGWHPGTVARAYSDLEMKVKHPGTQRIGAMN